MVIDTTDTYTLVPQIETYRAEIGMQIRRTLDEADQAENPLTLFYPAFWSLLPRGGSPSVNGSDQAMARQ